MFREFNRYIHTVYLMKSESKLLSRRNKLVESQTYAHIVQMREIS